MEAKELRIGNLVFDGKEVYEVSLLTFQKDREQGYYFKHLSPIPITDEWLRKADIAWKVVHSHKDVWSFWVSDEYSVDVRFIHEVQNLHYALYKEELIF